MNDTDTMVVAGPVLNGRWRLGPRLGGGGQAGTFLASDSLDGDLVVAKQFILPGQSDWKPFQLFEREVRVLRSLSHPQIPRFLDAFEDQPPGTFYLIMERVEGQSLRECRQDARFQQHELFNILVDVCRVLHYLHSLQPPVIHRDVKPANLVRDHQGLVHLVDFGGVRDAFRSEGGSTVVGTFGYMAPEQLHGLAMAATDIYALGMTIASLATGLEPEQIPRRGLRLNLDPLFPEGARQLVQLLGQMTEPDPEDRLGSAAAVLQRVQQIGEARPRSGHRQPEQTISAAVRVGAQAATGRISALAVGGCVLEQLDRQALERGPGVIELYLLVDGVELEGTTPLTLEGELDPTPPLRVAFRFRQLTLYEKRWILGAQVYAEL